jgi:hypothetical protein
MHAVKYIVATASDRSLGFRRSRHQRQKQRPVQGASIESNGSLSFLFFRYMLLIHADFQICGGFRPRLQEFRGIAGWRRPGWPCKPLKTLKTAKECLGQAQRLADKSLKRLGQFVRPIRTLARGAPFRRLRQEKPRETAGRAPLFPQTAFTPTARKPRGVSRRPSVAH